MYEGIVQAHEEIRKQVAFINSIVSEIGKPKFEYEHADFNQELFDKIVEATMDEAKAAMDTDDKNIREERWNKLIDHWQTHNIKKFSPKKEAVEDFIAHKDEFMKKQEVISLGYL